MPKTLNPQWREQFDFHLYEERGGIIDITAWDKDAGKRDDFIGRFVQIGIVFAWEMAVFFWKNIFVKSSCQQFWKKETFHYNAT